MCTLAQKILNKTKLDFALFELTMSDEQAIAFYQNDIRVTYVVIDIG